MKDLPVGENSLKESIQLEEVNQPVVEKNPIFKLYGHRMMKRMFNKI